MRWLHRLRRKAPGAPIPASGIIGATWRNPDGTCWFWEHGAPRPERLIPASEIPRHAPPPPDAEEDIRATLATAWATRPTRQNPRPV